MLDGAAAPGEDVNFSRFQVEWAAFPDPAMVPRVYVF
jgi:hypothetical protein